MPHEAARVGLIHPYWDFWASAVEGDFAADRRRLADIASNTIGECATIAWEVQLEPTQAPLAPGVLPERQVDAIVVACTMAAAPVATLEFLGLFPRTPVVLWAAYEGPSFASDITPPGLVARGATVGAQMVGAALASQGRPFDVLACSLQDARALEPGIRAAVAAGRVRRARLGVLGDPVPGYEWARPAEALLASIGVTTIALPAGTLVERAASVQADEIAVGRKELADVEVRAPKESVANATRYSLALFDLTVQESLDGGTLNCHDARAGFDRASSGRPCYALGACTTRGKPWTCTGDLATAVAMLLVASLGRPTLYHEIRSLDQVANLALLANSGEHDRRFVGSTRPKLATNPWFPGPPRTASLVYSLAAGPASLVGLASGGGKFKIVVAEGEFLERATDQTGTMNAAFRFASVGVADAWARWCQAGVGHHACATSGHVALDLELVCRHLGQELEVISSG